MTFYCGYEYNDEPDVPIAIPGSQISPADMEEVQDPAEVGKQIDAYLAAGRHENRCKMLLIQDEFILGVLNFHRGEHSFQCLPVGDELPADAIAEAVSYDIGYGGFLIRVWSSEFDIVPPGERAPLLFPMIEGFNMRAMAIVPVEVEQEQLLPEFQWPENMISPDDLKGINDAYKSIETRIFEGMGIPPDLVNPARTEPPQTEHEKQSHFFFKGE